MTVRHFGERGYLATYLEKEHGITGRNKSILIYMIIHP